MEGKLRWILPVLIAGTLMAGCHGTLIVEVLGSPTSTPTATPRARSTLIPFRSPSATPEPRLIPTSSTTRAPSPAPTEPPMPAEAAAALTQAPEPIEAPTSLPTPRSEPVVTTPTTKPPANALSPATSFQIAQGVSMKSSRMWHTATRLSDGRILLVGGSRAPDDFLAETEIFDAETGQTRLVAPLHTPRHAHTATLLPNGRMLVVGGYGLPRQWLDDAEVYDPVGDTWTVVPPRYSHATSSTATLMRDGRVLVVGGNTGSGLDTNRVDIFNPQTNAWSQARSLEFNRAGHTAQLLENGSVLVASGACTGNARCADGDALLYDPRADTWTPTGPMIQPRVAGESVRLSDGVVLVAGGQPLGVNAASLASTEIYDPNTNTWAAAPDLAQGRHDFDLVLLSDGQVLAVGGARDWDSYWTSNSFVREIELYDPARSEWRIVGELPQPRAGATATLLPDGRVWVAGGRTTDDRPYLSDTWLIGARSDSPGIDVPKEGDAVGMTISVSGPSPNDELSTGTNLYVLVKPQGLDYWLQPLPRMSNTGWLAEGVGIGQPADHGMPFRICAVLTTQTLSPGWHDPDPPPGPLTCIQVTRN
jgi:N-acetylneuraminic acid mutarotase